MNRSGERESLGWLLGLGALMMLSIMGMGYLLWMSYQHALPANLQIVAQQTEIYASAETGSAELVFDITVPNRGRLRARQDASVMLYDQANTAFHLLYSDWSLDLTPDGTAGQLRVHLVLTEDLMPGPMRITELGLGRLHYGHPSQYRSYALTEPVVVRRN